jgi:endo-1,4-beta-mannosidase
LFLFCISPLSLSEAQADEKGKTRLAVKGTCFTLQRRPTFLLGISYYGALGASKRTISQDLTQMQRMGFNWLRVWATWAAFGHDVSAVDGDGYPRPRLLKKLRWLVAECDRRGLVVDVTLSRGNGVTGPARLQTRKAHRRAVETLVTALRPYRNWYLDLANERNIKDRRFTSFAELKELCRVVKKLDGERLVTASHAGDITHEELREYLLTVRVDFLTPHRPRNADSAGETEARSRKYLAEMKKAGRVVPVHYQEPFRRGFGNYQPRAEDFLKDLRGSKVGGAAGWCFHNGDQRTHPRGLPRRSFDLREHSLFGQLDEEEEKTLPHLKKVLR